MQVEIPFREDMAKAVLDRNKFCTTRGSRYGEPGDWFPLKGGEYEIIAIMSLPLAYVATYLFRLEGFQDSLGFIEVWNELHPRRKFVGTDVRYTHFFIPKVIA